MENNKMNDLQSLYLLWATILNQSQSAEQVLLNTIELFNRLGIKKNFTDGFESLNYEKIEKAMMMKPCLHRFPKNMSINLASSIYLMMFVIIAKNMNIVEVDVDTDVSQMEI